METGGRQQSDVRDPSAASGSAQTPGAGVTGGKSLPTGTNKRWPALVLLAVGLVALFFVLNFLVDHPVGAPDFVNMYVAGVILRHRSPAQLYNPSLQLEIQRQIFPGSQFPPFFHLPFEAWLFVPLTFLSYRHAYLVWAGFNLLVLALLFYFLPQTGYRPDADSRLVWVASCFPIIVGDLVLGQDSLLLALVFLFAFLALKKRRDVAAGLMLGAGLFRFEILLPFAFIFLLRRRWKVLAGFAMTSAMASAISLAMLGLGGISHYARIILEAGQTRGNWMSSDVAAMPSLRGALSALFGPIIPNAWLFPLVLAATLLVLCWAAWKFDSIAAPEGRAFDLQFSFAVLATLLASYHLFTQEMTPFIIAAFLLLGYESAARNAQSLLHRPGTVLLLLFALTLIVGEALHFRNFSVLFVVLFGLIVWLSREIAEPQNA